MLELQEVSKVYRQGTRAVHALCGVDLTITTGEFVSIMGPSGSGKSTLLHLLAALDVPTSGKVLFEGCDFHRMSDRERSLVRRHRIGLVFQFFNLLPTLTAEENVAMPLLLAGLRRGQARARAQHHLERVGLERRAGHFPEEMSGGEMQRVAVARALVADPALLLCDEPTGNLDSANGGEILALLRSLAGQGGHTLVMVTHDEHAAAHGDRIVRLRDGQVEAEEYLRSAHALTVSNA